MSISFTAIREPSLDPIRTVRTCSAINTATSLLPIKEEIEVSDRDTLVLLDVGGTLLYPTDPLFHECNDGWKREWYAKHHPELSIEERRELARIAESFQVMNDSSWQCLDEWPELVKQAQRRNVKVIAFSRVIIDPCLEEELSARLANFDIPIKNDLPELVGKGVQFIYANGVIQTGEREKGPVLKEVISHLTHQPKKIIFVDDRMTQNESVQQACDELGIPAACFFYAGSNKPPLFNEAVANYQMDNLVRNRVWVSFEEASKRLSIGSSR